MTTDLNLKDKIFNSFSIYGVPTPTIKRLVCFRNRSFRYRTFGISCIENSTTIKELFIIAKLYLHNLVEKYKDYKLNRKKISNSTFNICLSYSDNKEERSPFSHKLIFDMEIDNTSNEILFENKHKITEDNETKIYHFSLDIEVELYNYNDPFIYDEEKDPIIKDVCIICKKNKPNVLITRCFHLVVCRNCDIKNSFEKGCPICKRKPLRGYHRIIFGRVNIEATKSISTSTTDLTQLSI